MRKINLTKLQLQHYEQSFLCSNIPATPAYVVYHPVGTIFNSVFFRDLFSDAPKKKIVTSGFQ